MRKRLTIALIILVLAPLATLGWLGVRAVRGEEAVLREQYDEVLTRELVAMDEDIARYLADLEQEIMRVVDEDPQHADRNLLNMGLAQQFLTVKVPRGDAFPPLPDRMSVAAREFWEKVVFAWGKADADAPPAQVAQAPLFVSRTAPARKRGWHTWYQDEGLRFLFWWQGDQDRLYCVDVDRMRILSDLVALLPETDLEDPLLASGRVVLRDARGQVLYQWGAYDPDAQARPRAQAALSPPVAAWQLNYYVDPALLSGAHHARYFGMGAGLAALTVALILVASYLYRESARESREAAQRITFVNQVSHELKTPLTTIRMYAELLEDELSENEQQQQKLDIIVGESRRLSRLIGNILTFSRKQRQQLALHLKPVRLSEHVGSLVASLRPALEAKGMSVELHRGPDSTVLADADAVEQILHNLISNAEKYAPSGRFVRVCHRVEDAWTVLEVEDHGPGIPAADVEKIFAPFYRASNKLTDGVAGSGIGLAIARELARLHGGDLEAATEDVGARFTCRLHTPPATEDTR